MKRGRDLLGRPVPVGSPDALPDVVDAARTPSQALALAQELLEQDRAFSAHEVLEAAWKAAPVPDRGLWQGLAQVCVGATHLQRGNAVGAVRLLRRGAQTLDGRAAEVAAWALRLADEVAGGAVGAGTVPAPWSGAGGRLRLPPGW